MNLNVTVISTTTSHIKRFCNHYNKHGQVMVPLHGAFLLFLPASFLINEFDLLLRSSVGSGNVAAVDKCRTLQWLFERSCMANAAGQEHVMAVT